MSEDIKLVVGYPASGKTTEVREFVDKGYHRINRDITGGSLKDMPAHIEKAVKAGHKQIVLDNTYPTAESRKDVIALGKKLKIPVTCLWMKTSVQDAMLNACLRMMDRIGRIPMPEEFAKINDPNIFPIAVMFKYQKAIEAKEEVPGQKKKVKINEPSTREGFESVDIRNFVRIWPSEYKNSAWIFDADGTLRESTGQYDWPIDPKEVKALAGAKEKIQEGIKAGHLILGGSNQSTCEKKETMTPRPIVDECFNQTNKLMGHDIEWSYCPHYRFPVSCYCRKPQCGMLAYMIHTYKLNPSLCTVFGDMTSDKTWATRCGMKFVHAKDFLK